MMFSFLNINVFVCLAQTLHVLRDKFLDEVIMYIETRHELVFILNVEMQFLFLFNRLFRSVKESSVQNVSVFL